MQRRRLLTIAIAWGAFALPRPAAAQSAETEEVAAQPDPETNAPADAPVKRASFESLEAEDEAPEPKKKKKRKGQRLEFKGRIIARAQLTSRRLDIVGSDLLRRERRLDSLDLSVPSARAGFHYHTHIPGVSAAASVELTGKPKLKDAFLQAKNGQLGLRVGQFKLPGSPFETASRLALPTAGRGFIHDILTDRLEIGGRRPGVAGFGKIKLKKDGVLELTLGAFQGSYLRDEATRDRSLMSMQALGAQTVVARAEAALAFAQLGLTGNYRVGTNELRQGDEEPAHFWSGGVDAAIDAWLGGGGLRLWADVNVGESWFVAAKRSATGRPLYTAVRGMAAFRGGGRERGELYVEPFVMVGGLDPDAKVSHDLATEAAAGVNAGFWQRGHATLQGGLTRTQRNFPGSFVLPDYRDQKTLLIQLGAQL
ncbi:MAG TPA: hypothetical protein VEQ59_22840 [Polyangiaceae bacterium]|nr:hypothetical protein [Polyangiaceae bacterium]